MMCGSRTWPPGSAFASGMTRLQGRGVMPGERPARPPEPQQQPDDAVRQYQRDQHEKAAEREQPEVREAGGEPSLAGVDEQRAERRAQERAAAADRDPDRDLDRVGGRELGRVDDPDLRHVEGATEARQHGRERPDEELSLERFVTEEAGAGFGVPDRDQEPT